MARDIRGVGFKTADQIAAKMGTAREAMIRIPAGVSYALAKAMDDSHCSLPEDELVKVIGGGMLVRALAGQRELRMDYRAAGQRRTSAWARSGPSA